MPPPTLKHDAPWRRVLVRLMPEHLTMGEVFARMGWSYTTQYQRRRWPDLRLSEAARMAVAAEVPVGLFLEACALEAGIEPLEGGGSPVTAKTDRDAHGRKRCSTCGRPGHTRRTCKTFDGMTEAQRMVARASVAPRKKRRARNRSKEA